MQFLSRTQSRTLTPVSIRNYLSGVKLLHLFTGADYPFTKDFILSLTLRGIARNALHTPRRAPPVTPSILLRISHVLDCEGDPRSSTLFCAFLFTFYLMARLANIVPKSAKSFDPRRHLTRGDVAVTSHGLLVAFKCTKTIQFGERLLHIPLLRITDSPLCPVSAYLRMIRLVPARRSCPVFLILGPKGLVLQSVVLFLLFAHTWSRPGFPMPRVSGVILFDEEQPRGPLGVEFQGKLSSCMVTGLVMPTNFIANEPAERRREAGEAAAL